jgi:MFS family permease
LNEVSLTSFGLVRLLSLAPYGLAMSMRMPIVKPHIADVIPVRRRTTVLGVYFLLSQETTTVTTPLIGYLIDLYGTNPVFISWAFGSALLLPSDGSSGVILDSRVFSRRKEWISQFMASSPSDFRDVDSYVSLDTLLRLPAPQPTKNLFLTLARTLNF